MKRILGASALLTISASSIAVIPAFAAVPAADYGYSMANTLTDSVGSSTLTAAPICSSPATEDLCNVSAEFGTNANGNFWHWTTTQGNGGGAALVTDAPLGETYSITVKFSLDELSNEEDPSKYSKIFDFKDLTDDAGIYAFGETSPYSIYTDLDSSDTEIALGEVVQMTLVRDASVTPATFTLYLATPTGFRKAFEAEDADGLYIAAASGSGSIIRLFQEEPEEVGTSHEGVKEGHLYGIEAWRNVALTEDQVREASSPDGLADTGASEDLSLLAAGIGIATLATGAALATRRRRV